MAFPWVAAAIVGSALVGAFSTGRSSRRMMKMQAEMTAEQLAFAKEQQAKLDVQKKKYAGMTFKNPYADVENMYEDLTVTTRMADFQASTFEQTRADILGGMRQTAGASGIAGLAQAMANQGQLQTEKISASIGQQEATNARLRAQGASAADMARRGGETWLQSAEMDRQAQLLGIQAGSAAGAAAGLQQAYSNQMAAASSAYAAEQAAWANVASSTINAAMYMKGGTPPKGASCFVENSKVLMKDGDFKNIQDIKTGNKVQNVNGEAIVKRLITHEINDVYRIYTNGSVNTTAEHPLYINGKWTNAKELNWDNELTYIDKLYNVETDDTFIVDDTVASGVLSLEFKQI
jgi:hypothetical protein